MVTILCLATYFKGEAFLRECREQGWASYRGGEVVFAAAFEYGRPPVEIAHDGGIFVTRRLPERPVE